MNSVILIYWLKKLKNCDYIVGYLFDLIESFMIAARDFLQEPATCELIIEDGYSEFYIFVYVHLDVLDWALGGKGSLTY
jgi:hypothetical protein